RQAEKKRAASWTKLHPPIAKRNTKLLGFQPSGIRLWRYLTDKSTEGWVENHTTHDILLDEDQGWQAESASKGSFIVVEFGGKPCLPSIAILKSPTGHSNDCRSHTTSGDFISIPGTPRSRGSEARLPLWICENLGGKAQIFDLIHYRPLQVVHLLRQPMVRW